MNLKIERNPRNGGLWCIFEHDGNEFYADVCDLHYGLPTECMIFSSYDGRVTNWTELYCKRGVPVTEEGLTNCIEEFIKQYDEENGKL